MRKSALFAMLLGLLALAPRVSQALGEVAPDFTLRDVNNQNVTLASQKGKVVLLNFWATWCQPCRAEQSKLEIIYQELKPQGFEILAISADDARSASQVKPMVMRAGLSFPVLLDPATSVVAQYNPAKALPYNVIIDRTGKIRQVHQGYNPGDEVGLRAEIVALLAEPAAP